MNRIITISREFGSGGRELGRRLAEQMNMAYYDQEIISEIAKRTDLAEHYVDQIVEQNGSCLFPSILGAVFIWCKTLRSRCSRRYFWSSRISYGRWRKSRTV